MPKLEQLKKEGESGYAKINQYTRYLDGRPRRRRRRGLRATSSSGSGVLNLNTGRLVLIVITLTRRHARC